MDARRHARDTWVHLNFLQGVEAALSLLQEVTNKWGSTTKRH